MDIESRRAYRPWPVKDPHSVVQVMIRMPDGSLFVEGFRPVEYRLIEPQARTFAGLALWLMSDVRLDDGEVHGCYVSSNFFATLGAPIARGRGFDSSDDRPESPSAVAVLSDRMWRRQFDAFHRSGRPGLSLEAGRRRARVHRGSDIVACMAFGLAPAFHASHTSPAGALKSSGLRLRSALLSVQIAASVVLLICLGLLVRAVSHAGNQDLGFRVGGVSLVTVDLPGWHEPARIRAFVQRLFQESSDLAAATFAPFDRLQTPAVVVEGRRVPSYAVSPSFCAALRIPVVGGRSFQPADTGRTVVMVNETAWYSSGRARSAFA